VGQHHEQAVRLAWRLTGADRATAEEVAQDAFLAAHDKLHTLQEVDALPGWFFRIVARKSANHRRWLGVRRRFTRLFQPDPTACPASPDPPLRDVIQAAMDALSPGQREVFVLVYLEGFTLDQSAQILGKAPGTVRTHLHRALKALRRDLEHVREEQR
jgi:RNA polymerase sigma-70 factor (ECF subfamily)